MNDLKSFLQDWGVDPRRAPHSRSIPAGTESSAWTLWAPYMAKHLEIPAIATLVYVTVILVGQWLMRSRTSLPSRPLAFLWFGALAAFSITGAYEYVFKVLIPIIAKKGVTYEACTLDSEYATPWAMYFCLSKIPELFDTVLHVIRKQRIIFLHVYHHITVMWFCWFAWAYRIENGGTIIFLLSHPLPLVSCLRSRFVCSFLIKLGLFAGMNLIVHSIMYTYFAIVALGVRFPNQVRMTITLLQIVQMARLASHLLRLY